MKDYTQLSKIFNLVCLLLEERGFRIDRSNKDIDIITEPEYFAELSSSKKEFSTLEIRRVYDAIIDLLKQNDFESKYVDHLGVKIYFPSDEVFISITHFGRTFAIVACMFG